MSQLNCTTRVGDYLIERVRLTDFVRGLAEAGLPRFAAADAPWTPVVGPPPAIDPATPITVDRVFARLVEYLTPGVVVIADPGDALFGAADLPVERGTGFLSPAYYASLGFAVPASIGAGLADPKVRPLALVGDGAFQMTGQELATAVRFGVAPVVIVLNNDGYATERFIRDGPFNDVLRWEHSQLPALFGAGKGYRVETDGELAEALGAAFADDSVYSIIDVRLGRFDVSAGLRGLAARLK